MKKSLIENIEKTEQKMIDRLTAKQLNWMDINQLMELSEVMHEYLLREYNNEWCKLTRRYMWYYNTFNSIRELIEEKKKEFIR